MSDREELFETYLQTDFRTTPAGPVLEAFYTDAEYRARVDADPREALAEKGLSFPPEIDVSVHVNTPDIFHFVLPPDPNVELADESLAVVAGGKTASSAGSVGSASTAGCLPSTASTAGTASSAGSVGSAS